MLNSLTESAFAKAHKTTTLDISASTDLENRIVIQCVIVYTLLFLGQIELTAIFSKHI